MGRDVRVSSQRRTASERLVATLVASNDPVVAYKASVLRGLDPGSAEALAMRERIAGSAMARALLGGGVRPRLIEVVDGVLWTGGAGQDRR